MKAPGTRRAVFFDRDGTLMEEVHYCNDPAKVRAVPGAAEALAELAADGWLRVMATNQSGIGSGRITMEQFEAVQAELLRQLDGGIDAVYFCPDTREQATHRRKPAPGMVEDAAHDHGIDLARSFFIGDRDIDLQCGHRAEMRSILVLTGYGHEHTAAGADHIAENVTEAVHWILAETKAEMQSTHR